MNAYLPRGLAVLALLCLLPRASAISVTLLSDNRGMSVTSTYGQTNMASSAAPAGPFADFYGALGAVGVHITQASTVAPTYYQSVGSYSANTFLGTPSSNYGNAPYDVTFRLDTNALFTFWTYREVGVFGINDMTFGRVGFLPLVSVSGPTPIRNIFSTSGFLTPGIYNIKVTSAVGASSDGLFYHQDMTSGNYKMYLSLHDVSIVSDAGSTAAFFLAALCIVGGVHRRRMAPR